MDMRQLRYFIAVADERHVGRAASRLHMSQPPLSRAIQQLEHELGVVLFDRLPTGVALTPAGEVLQEEARDLLERFGQVRARVQSAAGRSLLTVGTLSDIAVEVGLRVAAAFRDDHPRVDVHVREGDLADPTVGLRSGLVDVAFTRLPFDTAGIDTLVLRTEPVGVLLRADDPLASRSSLVRADLAQRTWYRLPVSTDPAWQEYWTRGARGAAGDDVPVVRTIQECVQAVLWTASIGLIPMVHTMPRELVAIPLADQPPSRFVIAWHEGDTRPLVQAFVSATVAAFRRPGGAVRLSSDGLVTDLPD